MNPATGDHFHVLQSSRPDGGFAQLNNDAFGPGQTLIYTDFLASNPTGMYPHVWHYLLLTSDDCENDNGAWDRFGGP